MKRKITSILLIILLIATAAYAAGTGLKHMIVRTGASDQLYQVVTAKPGLLYQLVIKGNGSNTNTFDIYDFASNGGYTTKEVEMVPSVTIGAGTTGQDWLQVINFNPPVRFYKGLYTIMESSTNEVGVYWLNEQ